MSAFGFMEDKWRTGFYGRQGPVSGPNLWKWREMSFL